jgi:site-specific DNA-methyltransferase (adenine-specific)
MAKKAAAVIEQEYALVPVGDICPHPRNPRKGAIDAIDQSIDENGFYGAVIVQRATRLILAGRHRWERAKAKGIALLPVLWADVDDPTALRIIAADNRTSDLAGYDPQALAVLLESCRSDSGGFDGTGYDEKAFDEILASAGEAILRANEGAHGAAPEEEPVPVDRADELLAKWSVQPGQLWEIGRHRLLCGDSTSRADLERLIDGEKVDMVFTDPPYGVKFGEANHNPRAKRWDGIQNDDKKGDDLRAFLKACFDNFVWASAPAAPVYCWSPTLLAAYEMLQALLEAEVHVQSQLVWVKNCLVLGQADYQWRHEFCWYGWTKGKNHYWDGGRALTTVWDHRKDANSSYEHPMQKPVSLAAEALKNSCRPAGSVLDLFAGSGGTGAAADAQGKSARLMEIEPKYCSIILERLTRLGLSPSLIQ